MWIKYGLNNNVLLLLAHYFFAQLENLWSCVTCQSRGPGNRSFLFWEMGDQGCLVSRRLSGSDTMWVSWPSPAQGMTPLIPGEQFAQGRHLLLSAQGGNSRFGGGDSLGRMHPFPEPPSQFLLGWLPFFFWSVVKSHHIINAHIQLWVPLNTIPTSSMSDLEIIPHLWAWALLLFVLVCFVLFFFFNLLFIYLFILVGATQHLGS